MNNSVSPEENPVGPVIREDVPLLGPPPAPQKRWKRILHWEHSGLFLIVLITLAFHFAAIERPPNIAWDEVWYVGDARSIMVGTGDLRPEHPPLAKLFIVAGYYIGTGFTSPETNTGASTIQELGATSGDNTVINVSSTSGFSPGQTIRINAEQMEVISVDSDLGQITVKRGTGGTTVSGHESQQEIFVFSNNALGWRLFSVIFGTIGIIIFYFIVRKLKFSWKATMIATFLFAFENMTFLHSGLALLDVYMVTFMLAALLFYLNRNYLLMGVFVALSAECKLAGVMIIFAIILHWLIFRRDKTVYFAGSLLLAAVSFLFFLTFFDFFINGNIENPITRTFNMLNATAINDFTIPKSSISSRPWTWIYPQWFDLYYNSPNVPFIIYYYDPQYISFISSTIQILIVPTVGYLAYRSIKGSQAAALLLLWFFATYLLWIPLDIATNRVTFVFYFLTTTPAICIGLGMGLADVLDRLKARWQRLNRLTPGVGISYGVVIFYLLLHVAIFIVFNPAIPTIIKTWLPPFSIGVDPTAARQGLITLMSVPLIFWKH